MKVDKNKLTKEKTIDCRNTDYEMRQRYSMDKYTRNKRLYEYLKNKGFNVSMVCANNDYKKPEAVLVSAKKPKPGVTVKCCVWPS